MKSIEPLAIFPVSILLAARGPVEQTGQEE
jgi:hypothetical protein